MRDAVWGVGVAEVQDNFENQKSRLRFDISYIIINLTGVPFGRTEVCSVICLWASLNQVIWTTCSMPSGLGVPRFAPAVG